MVPRGAEASAAAARPPNDNDVSTRHGSLSRAMSTTPSTAAASALMRAASAQYDSRESWSTPLRIRLRPHEPLQTRPLLLAASYETTLEQLMERLGDVLGVDDEELRGLRIEIEGFTIAQDDTSAQVGALIRETDVVDVYLDDMSEAVSDDRYAIEAAVNALVKGAADAARQPMSSDMMIEASSVLPLKHVSEPRRAEDRSSQSSLEEVEAASSSSSSSSSSSEDESSATDSSGSESDSSSDASSSSGSGSSDQSSSETSSHSHGEANRSAKLPVSATAQALASSNGWVPPGRGSAQTKRNNRARRRKERTQVEEERERLFVEAKTRAEKRAAGECVVDRTGSTAGDGYDAQPTKKQRRLDNVEMVNGDGLPPGGGSLGISTTSDLDEFIMAKKKSKPDARKSQTAQKPKPVPPPTMRGEPVPPGVRLTRFDCDGCFNAWPTEESTDSLADHQATASTGQSDVRIQDLKASDARALYAAFQAQGKAALEAMRRADGVQEESALSVAQNGDSSAADGSGELMLPPGIPMAFGKPANWEGHGIVASQRMQPAPMSTSDISLRRPSPVSVPTKTTAKAPKAVAASNKITFLDYSEPAESADSMAQSLQRLRELRDLARQRSEQHKAEQQAASGLSSSTNTSSTSESSAAADTSVGNLLDLAAIRSAALASRKKKAAQAAAQA